jgi:hypothetical protein
LDGVQRPYSVSSNLDHRPDHGHQNIPLAGAGLDNAVHFSLTVGYRSAWD